jgi:hypothetical protein
MTKTDKIKYNEPMVKIYINVFSWGVANNIYRSKKLADEDASDRERYLCIETFITRTQWNKYKGKEDLFHIS